MIIFIRVDHHHVYTLVKNVIILFGFSSGVKMSGHLLAPELNYRFLIMNAHLAGNSVAGFCQNETANRRTVKWLRGK